MGENRIVKGLCFGCLSLCGTIFHVEDEKITKIEGNPEHPVSKGFICAKSQATQEIISHPDRILYPLKRAGAKGEGKWKRISWDEALDEIATKLVENKEKFGPESFVLSSGIFSILAGLNWYIGSFLHSFGSPNHLRPSYLCLMPAVYGGVYTFGFNPVSPDCINSKCIAVWGANPEMSWPFIAKDIDQAKDKGAKLIVIDPRRTGIASRADIWMQIRPGTDAALALGMLNVIINEDLYDADFVDKWTYGFGKFKEHVKDYSPEKVEEITWVPAKLIRDGARLFAQNSPASILPGAAGMTQHINSFQANRAISVLAAITGNLDIPGGQLHTLGPLRRRSSMAAETDAPFGKLSKEQVAKRLGIDRMGVIRQTGMHMCHASAVWDAIIDGDPYPVKTMLTLGGNLVAGYDNSLRTRQALSELDFFACVGLEMSPTVEMADIVLPAAHWTERDEVIDSGQYVFAHQKVLDSPGECWEDRKVLIELAKRLNFDGFWDSIEASLNHRVEPLGMKWEEFKKEGMVERPKEYKKYEKLGFKTVTGKVDIYSKALEKLDLPPLPVHREPPESPANTPELAKDYPLVLIAGFRDAKLLTTQYRHIKSLAKEYPEPLLDIHPETAKELGIKDGDWVRVESPRGSIKQKARLFDGVDPRVVATTFGWWYGFENGWKEVNINVLTQDKPFGAEVGSTPIKSLLCRVVKR